MNLFSFFKENHKEKNSSQSGLGYAKTFKGNSPVYGAFGDSVMRDETVFSIAQRIINEYSKLQPQHIRTVNNKKVLPADNIINNLLKRPNNRERTTSDFLAKCAYLYLTYDNVFIYPAYDLYINKKTQQKKKVYKSFNILVPQRVEFFEDASGKIFVDFTFMNGVKSGLLDYDDIIHWRKDYTANDFMGGDERGLPNNSALLKHLTLNDQLLQSTIKAVNSSLTINGLIRLVGMMSDEKKEQNRLTFEKQLKNNETGLMVVDSGSEYIPINRSGQVVDKEILKFLDTKTRRHYGVSEALLDGDYTEAQKTAFYETVLEHGIVSFGQAISRVLFTDFEAANGNEVILYPNRIQMMNLSTQIQFSNLLLPVGGITANEIREFGGLPPIEGGDVPQKSLNWVNADIADDYQLEIYKYGNKNINKNDENSYNNNDSDKKTTDDVVDEIVDEAQEIVKTPLLVGQIQALSDIVAAYQEEKYTYNQAKNMLTIAVGLTDAEAEKILDKQDEIIEELEEGEENA